MTVIDTATTTHRRRNVVVGVAAAFILIAMLATVIFTRRTEPNAVNAVDDLAIAGSALMTVDQLGSGWSQLPGDGSTSLIAKVAATVPECAAYVDAFASPRQSAVLAERDFQGETAKPLTNIVYMYPTAAAATEAMNKMAEPGFRQCFNVFIDALTPPTGGIRSHTTTAAAPPFAAHGDAQVVVPQEIDYPGQGSFTIISFFVQVGRGIVYVDPFLRKSDPTDASGKLEHVVATATDALSAALQSSG